MRIGAVTIRPRMFFYVFAFFFIASANFLASGLAAEPRTPPQSIRIFQSDSAVQRSHRRPGARSDDGRGSRQPNQRSGGSESDDRRCPAGWDINFNSRYPSFPVRSVMVQGGDQTTNKSTTLEFKAKIPENTKPGNLSGQSHGQR